MNQSQTSARHFFDQATQGPNPVDFIRSLVDSSNPAVENDWLEFKANPRPDPKEPNKDSVKRYWSQALSGFANTQGGVLIWGIQAKPNENKVDAAGNFQLVDNPARLASRLMELHHQATDPPVMGVEVQPVEDPSEPGKGFVVCYVPESPYAPHRAEYHDRNYYIRAGDDFVVPAVSMLRRMFYPQTSPVFVAHGVLYYRSNSPQLEDQQRTRLTTHGWEELINGKYSISIQLDFENTGNATARNPSVRFAMSPALGPNVQPYAGSGWNLHSQQPTLVVLRSNYPIHPGERAQVVTLVPTYLFPGNLSSPESGPVPTFANVELNVSIFSDNTEEQAFAFDFRSDRLTFESPGLHVTGQPVFASSRR